tara:strand:- start:12 stop:461 length:450 start_codon:yes stop_codon:yes gene_type:complete
MDKKEYQRLYYQKNKKRLDAKRDKDKVSLYYKEYSIKNKDKKRDYYNIWSENNKQKLIEYRQTDTFKKRSIISQWRYRGILCFDFDLLYDIFLSTKICENCNCELNTNTKTRKCLDHDHNITDKFNVRGVLCHSCNIKDVLKQTTTNSL